MKRVILLMMICLLPIGAVMAQQVINPAIEGDTPDDRYIIHDDGTVTDVWTNLMWQQCSLGKSGANCVEGTYVYTTWDQAMQQAESDMTAGYDDWRLPNIKELQSLAAYDRAFPAIHLTMFPDTFTSHYRSSTLFGHAGTYTINFNNATAHSINRMSNTYIRLVRDIE